MVINNLIRLLNLTEHSVSQTRWVDYFIRPLYQQPVIRLVLMSVKIMQFCGQSFVMMCLSSALKPGVIMSNCTLQSFKFTLLPKTKDLHSNH